jgi:hypothetical protein
MPRKSDHQQARAELAKLAPEALQVVTARLPAGVLIKIHRWAEEKRLDLAAALRELMTLGLETATGPAPPTADRKEVKRWEKPVEKALKEGRSPLEPFLEQPFPEEGEPDVEVLRAVLARLDYKAIYRHVMEHRETEETPAEREWKRLKAAAPSHVRPLTDALDKLEEQFRARKKRSYVGDPEDEGRPVVNWLLSEEVMQALAQPSSSDREIEQVRQLIAARYLVARPPNAPWTFEWDE